MKLLLVEDEKSLSRVLVKILKNNNYSVDAVFNGEDALEYLRTYEYDAAIMDIMIPKIDGIEVLKRIRSENNRTPIIMLTAKSQIEDKVFGLDSGANDYLTKPFDTRELLARIRNITRGKDEVDNKLSIGDIKLDKLTYELSSNFGSIKLKSKEFQMMEMLMQNPNIIIPIDTFFEKIWGYDNETEINVVWVYISYLRKKLKDLKSNVKIKVSRNIGYYMENKWLTN